MTEMHDDGRCSSNGGTGIGAGHVCRCTRPAGHPRDGRAAGSDHGCPCGAHWSTPEPDVEGGDRG